MSDRLEEARANRNHEVTEEQANHDALYSNPEYAEAYEKGKEKGVEDPHGYAREVIAGEGEEKQQLSLDDSDDGNG